MKQIVQLLPVTILVVAACASSRPTINQTNASLAVPDTKAEMCPMKVPGTTVVSADVEGGAALVFSTTGDRTLLREHVQRMAAMHNEMSGDGMMVNAAGPWSKHHHVRRHMAGQIMPVSLATAEDTESGARLVFRPKDPQKLEALRTSVRSHALNMERGKCLMAESMPAGGKGGTQP